MKDGPYKYGRFYVAPLFIDPLFDGQTEGTVIDSSMGLTADQQSIYSSVDRSLEKAVAGKYTHFVFSESQAWASEDYGDLLNCVAQHRLKIIQQVSASHFYRFWHKYSEMMLEYRCRIELILDVHIDFDDILKLIPEVLGKILVIVPCLDVVPVKALLKLIPRHLYSQTQILCPLSESNSYLAYTPKQINRLYKYVLQRGMVGLWRPLFGRDVYEPRIKVNRDLELLVQPIVRRQVESVCKVSVVIPSYNSGSSLLTVLEHLANQDLNYKDYEVVIVDDGSNDRTTDDVCHFFENTKMNMTLLYAPRMSVRKMGDDQFRAGLSRNLGVKFAVGKLISFIDSDILVSPDFLSEIFKLHRHYDVVQWRREHLNAHTKKMNLKYHEIDISKHCYTPEAGYWHRFYAEASQKGWESLDNPWKYTCTYCLSLTKEMFEQLGSFRKTFCFYGFEDTDLGWRIFGAGAKVYFHDQPVFHLYHQDERSEYLDSGYKRQMLLKQTAKIFYKNNLEPEIYKVLKSYLREGFFS